MEIGDDFNDFRKKNNTGNKRGINHKNNHHKNNHLLKLMLTNFFYRFRFVFFVKDCLIDRTCYSPLVQDSHEILRFQKLILNIEYVYDVDQ